MAATITKTKATPNRLVFSVVGDGVVTTGTITSADLIAAAVNGPLKSALQASYANQAAMRAVIGGGNVELTISARTLASTNSSFAADVDADGTTPTRPKVSLVVPATASSAWLVLEFKHTFIR